MSAPKAKPAATCRLTLTIAGVEYRCRRVEAPAGFKVAWSLARTHPKLGRVAHVVAASAAGSTTCDCRAHEFRRDRQAACKHQLAARACGIL